ncbi:hypothetical protein [Terribacillus saccharophilus]|uniref:Uncharacterized protein n=1 Tax=Terribacillus saccharophilus TaxID=361277 RepID=A0ABX4H080_9BACI|nr:hypothetical protein [Terribacillus saccharophilus]PAD35988.1 hypothetical protein CHH56_06060 [Terribacillus saccharophilus]PAD96962.1 hypothetical protein CHH50_06250 [Terribacillus saccharophilus]PAE00538.1 hypothetical protein CHH48_07155 [Terribacillus saccharophilus]
MQRPVKGTQKAIPFFEVYVCLISAYISVVLLVSDIFEKDANFYQYMTAVMPAVAWGLVAFAASVLIALGLVLNCRWLRIGGLAISMFFYVFLATSSMLDFPNMSAGVYFITALMSLLSIFYVRFSEL